MNPSYEAMRIAREEKQEKLLKAARWHAVRELEKLKLDSSSSHVNLASIASAIYEPYTWWTQGACDALRRHLIYLIGDGREADCVHEHPDTADSCVRRDESKEVGYPITQYDVLGNERHKAVCKLSGISVDELCEKYDYVDVYPEFVWSIGKAIGLRYGAGFEEIISQLIHLLGGDQDVKNAEIYNIEDERVPQDDMNGKSSQNEDSPISITSELRMYAMTRISPNKGMLESIADRIDEQFNRICEQQEKVLRDTIDYTQDESEDAVEFAHRIEEAVQNEEDVTLFGVDYTPRDLVQDAERDYVLTEFYRELRHTLGQTKHLRDKIAAHSKTLKQVENELDECRKALNEANGRWAKADKECQMYRDILNDEAREYVRHKEATDSIYKSFNEMFKAIEECL